MLCSGVKGVRSRPADLRHLSAEIRFAEETGSTNDTNAATMSPHSFVATTVNESSLRSTITGDDLAGHHKDWLPISTAPIEQDLSP